MFFQTVSENYLKLMMVWLKIEIYVSYNWGGSSFSNDFSWSAGVPVGRFGFLAWHDVGESLLILFSLQSSAKSFSSLLHLSNFWGLLSDFTCFSQSSVLFAHLIIYIN